MIGILYYLVMVLSVIVYFDNTYITYEIIIGILISVILIDYFYNRKRKVYYGAINNNKDAVFIKNKKSLSETLSSSIDYIDSHQRIADEEAFQRQLEVEDDINVLYPRVDDKEEYQKLTKGNIYEIQIYKYLSAVKKYSNFNILKIYQKGLVTGLKDQKQDIIVDIKSKEKKYRYYLQCKNWDAFQYSEKEEDGFKKNDPSILLGYIKKDLNSLDNTFSNFGTVIYVLNKGDIVDDEIRDCYKKSVHFITIPSIKNFIENKEDSIQILTNETNRFQYDTDINKATKNFIVALLQSAMLGLSK